MLELTRTISLIEVLWVTVVGIALIFHAWMLRDVIYDLVYLKRLKQNGLREIVARSNIRAEAIRCFVQTLFLFVGVTAMLRPSPPVVGGDEIDIVRVITISFLILAALLLALLSVLDRRDRQRILNFRRQDMDRHVSNGEVEAIAERKASEVVLRVAEAAHDEAAAHVQEEAAKDAKEQDAPNS